MNDVRVGRAVRALRRRRVWGQCDLAARSRCSQSLVSLIERGHLGSVSIRGLRVVLGALDAVTIIDVRWRAGELERLLDEDRAALVARVAAELRAAG